MRHIAVSVKENNVISAVLKVIRLCPLTAEREKTAQVDTL